MRVRVAFALLAVLASAARAQDALVVGIKETPPFVIRVEDDTWSGISIELWERAAKRLGRTFTYRETDLAGLLRGVEDGSLDAAVAALSVTAEREAVMDFTQPFHWSGLGIAVPARPEAGLGDVVLGIWGSIASCVTYAPIRGRPRYPVPSTQYLSAMRAQCAAGFGDRLLVRAPAARVADTRPETKNQKPETRNQTCAPRVRR